MGLILDSSVLTPAERKGQNAHAPIADLLKRLPEEDLAVSVVTVVELAHGVVRSNTPAREMRRQFLLELIGAVPVYSVTTSIALSAGRMDGTALPGERGLHLLTCSSVPQPWTLAIELLPSIFGTFR